MLSVLKVMERWSSLVAHQSQLFRFFFPFLSYTFLPRQAPTSIGQCLVLRLRVHRSDGKERRNERKWEAEGEGRRLTLKSTVSFPLILGQKKSSQLYERHIEKKKKKENQ